MTRPRTDAERGRGLVLDLDRHGVPHRSLRHDVERVETEEYEDTECCAACGATARVLDAERCPAKDIPGVREARIEVRSIRADGHDRTLTGLESGGDVDETLAKDYRSDSRSNAEADTSALEPVESLDESYEDLTGGHEHDRRSALGVRKGKHEPVNDE